MVANTADDVYAGHDRVDARGPHREPQAVEPRHVRALCVVANEDGVPAEGHPAQGSFGVVVVEGDPEILGNPAERPPTLSVLSGCRCQCGSGVALGWTILSSSQAFNRSWAGPARPWRKPNGESDPTMPWGPCTSPRPLERPALRRLFGGRVPCSTSEQPQSRVSPCEQAAAAGLLHA